MRYKGFYIKISPDSNIRRVDKKGRDILCEGFLIQVFADETERIEIDNFSAAVNFDTGTKLSPMKDRLMNMISDNYRQIYTIYSEGKSDKEKLYLRLLLVTDFVCGMTDSYAKRLYQELSGIE